MGTTRILAGFAVTSLLAVGVPFLASTQADDDCDARVDEARVLGRVVVDVERSFSAWPPGVRCTLVRGDGTSDEAVWPWDR